MDLDYLDAMLIKEDLDHFEKYFDPLHKNDREEQHKYSNDSCDTITCFFRELYKNLTLTKKEESLKKEKEINR